MALRRPDALRGRRVRTCGSERRRQTHTHGDQKVCAGIITPRKRHRRLCYAHGSLHSHSQKTSRSSFLSSSLSEPGFASVLTLRGSLSKEALGWSPAFSPAVLTLSSLFLSAELVILLGKDWLVMQRPFMPSSSQPRRYVPGIDLLWLIPLTLHYITVAEENAHERRPCGKTAPRSRASLWEQMGYRARQQLALCTERGSKSYRLPFISTTNTMLHFPFKTKKTCCYMSCGKTNVDVSYSRSTKIKSLQKYTCPTMAKESLVSCHLTST